MLINPITNSQNIYNVRANKRSNNQNLFNTNPLGADTVSFSGWGQLTKEELKLKNKLAKLIYNKNQAIAQDTAEKLGIKIPEQGDDAAKEALVKEVAHNIRLVFASTCRKDKNPQVRLPQTPEDEKAVIEFLENRAPLDTYLEKMEEKTLLERKINRLNGLMNRDSKTGEDIKEIGEIRDKLDKYGNAEKHLESLENAIKDEKSKYGKEINFIEKLDQLEKTYTELKLITQKELNEYYDSFNKHFLNRDRKLSAQELLDIFRRGEAANYAQTTKEAEKIAAAKAQKAEEARDFALRQKQQKAAQRAAEEKLTAQRRKAAEQARIAKSGPAIQPGENIVIEAGKGFEQSLRKVISIYRDNFEVANVFGQDLITRTAERYGRVYPNIGTRLKAVINDKINIYNKHVQNVGIPDLSLYNIGKYLNYLDKGILEIMDGQEKVNKLRKLNNSSKGNERTKAQLEKAKATLKRSKARWLDGVKKLVKGEEYNRNVFVELGQAESYDYLNGMNKELLLYKRINKLSQEKHARLTNADWDKILSNFEREHVNANIAYYEKLHSSNN